MKKIILTLAVALAAIGCETKNDKGGGKTPAPTPPAADGMFLSTHTIPGATGGEVLTFNNDILYIVDSAGQIKKVENGVSTAVDSLALSPYSATEVNATYVPTLDLPAPYSTAYPASIYVFGIDQSMSILGVNVHQEGGNWSLDPQFDCVAAAADYIYVYAFCDLGTIRRVNTLDGSEISIPAVGNLYAGDGLVVVLNDYDFQIFDLDLQLVSTGTGTYRHAAVVGGTAYGVSENKLVNLSTGKTITDTRIGTEPWELDKCGANLCVRNSIGTYLKFKTF